MSPLQRNFNSVKASDIMAYAVENNINFFDTAQLYENYSFFKELFKRGVNRNDIIIATKSYSYDAKTAKESVDIALNQMGTDRIDFMLLHEQESIHTLRGHEEALMTFIDYKDKGVIDAIGISTHYISGVKAVMDDDRIDIIHPIINKAGIGIVDGNSNEMEKYIKKAHLNGKFIYSMKALGGGHLISSYEESIRYIKGKDYIDSIAIGMESYEEIDANIRSIEKDIYTNGIQKNNRKIFIDSYCIGCGKCAKRCQIGAIKIINNIAIVDHEKCNLCSYCVKACKDFYIKVL